MRKCERRPTARATRQPDPRSRQTRRPRRTLGGCGLRCERLDELPRWPDVCDAPHVHTGVERPGVQEVGGSVVGGRLRPEEGLGRALACDRAVLHRGRDPAREGRADAVRGPDPAGPAGVVTQPAACRVVRDHSMRGVGPSEPEQLGQDRFAGVEAALLVVRMGVAFVAEQEDACRQPPRRRQRQAPPAYLRRR